MRASLLLLPAVALAAVGPPSGHHAAAKRWASLHPEKRGSPYYGDYPKPEHETGGGYDGAEGGESPYYGNYPKPESEKGGGHDGGAGHAGAKSSGESPYYGNYPKPESEKGGGVHDGANRAEYGGHGGDHGSIGQKPKGKHGKGGNGKCRAKPVGGEAGGEASVPVATPAEGEASTADATPAEGDAAAPTPIPAEGETPAHLAGEAPAEAPVETPAKTPSPSLSPSPSTAEEPKPSPSPAEEPKPSPSTAEESTPTPTPTPSPQPEKGGGGETHTGIGTYYHPVDSGQPGACGMHHDDSSWVVAVHEGYFNDYPGAVPGNPYANPLCGKKVKIEYEGKTTEATIVDSCRTCGTRDDIDLTPAIFESWADKKVGKIPVTWTILD